MRGERAGARSDFVCRFDAHRSHGKQAQGEAGGGCKAPKAYLAELDVRDRDREALEKKPSGREDDGHKGTVERSFAKAKENHGLRYTRMLGIRNMREQSLLIAAVQNIKRLVASHFSSLTPA